MHVINTHFYYASVTVHISLTTPNVMAQREMVVHCFCVVDKIRKELTLEEYIKMVRDPDWSGNIFMTKAMECVREWQTLPLFFTTDLPEIITPEKQIPDNSSSTKDAESLPDQKQKEFQEESPLNFSRITNGKAQTSIFVMLFYIHLFWSFVFRNYFSRSNRKGERIDSITIVK